MIDEFSEVPADGDAADEDADAEEAAKDEGPDLLLRETARIVGDVVELESDIQLLDLKFSQLTRKDTAAPQLN
ncbi:hypothetical protein D3C83_81800 [compost metagenome]